MDGTQSPTKVGFPTGRAERVEIDSETKKHLIDLARPCEHCASCSLRIQLAAMQIERLPRFPLAQLPTPVEKLERLSRELGGPQLLIKRDDQTGLALGGNKTRKLEFLVGQALEQGADTLVTAGAAQSNHCRQTAA